VRGPADAEAAPVPDGVLARRYRCQQCGAVITVVPAEVLPRRLYAASAIALALALFGVVGLPPGGVRARVSPWRVVGATAAARWATLRRWVDAVRGGLLWRCVRAAPPLWSRRQIAARAATTIAAHAPPATPALPITAAVFGGAMRAR
jgi:hypothetical protein